jgi:large subunit ribosomal protein L17
MRHRKANIKLGRTASHRDAMLRNMATSLFDKKSIITTVHKAKALRPLADKLVGLAKKGDLAAYRRALGYFTKNRIGKLLFKSVKDDDAFGDRSCGYTTMGRIGLRKGDAAVLVKISLIGPGYKKKVATGPRKVTHRDRRLRVAASRAKAEKGKD